ncbi:short-chain dehydrogenase [Flavipsychrobacter stenotrophus]|uniref:Short-chain dehydrogenase n=1 Tax=Flavipsychrobacter stenotrophus TaxID=2077091 RepID=A0A2S7T0D5_9BACT|nr:SDR family oxidoreductase [Flavipsychrobacter stenotrophus]PQJ12341.1 short-chain dehydrogenase [Flavipsychrobacter stenotrophus]
MKKLEDKTIFITGGLSGIGKACAIAAAKQGANIVIVDMKSATTDNAMEEIKRENSKAIFIDCDVSVFAQVQAAVEKVVSTFGALDVALNNAGIGGEPNKIGDMTEQQWLKVININLNGVFNCMKHELAQMSKQKKGVIVNMASILGKVGFATSSHYVAAKHGVIGLTQTAALEYATEGIRINAICPGFIDTPLLSNAGITDHSDVKHHIIDLHPIKRLGKDVEIASGFIFLACDESSFMSGTTMEIDGGYLAQ